MLQDMSVISETSTKGINNLSIKIHSIENWPILDPDAYFSLRLEHQGVDRGHSDPFQLYEDHVIVEKQFEYGLRSTNDQTLEALCNDPFVISICGVQQQRTRSKGRKSQRPADVLGICCFDFSGLLKENGQNGQCFRLPIIWTSSVYVNQNRTAFMNIDILSESPLIQEEANLTKLRLESLQCLPNSMLQRQGKKMLCLVPKLDDDVLSGDREEFLNGILTEPSESGYYPDQYKYNGSFDKPDEFVPGNDTKAGSYSDVEEHGDYTWGDDENLRKRGNRVEAKIVWNQERRILFLGDKISRLRDRIAQYPWLPVEIVEVRKPVHRKSQEEYKYHGVAYINLKPLIYPGEKRIRGAYKVVPFDETEYSMKTKRTKPLLEAYVQDKQSPSRKTTATAKSPTELVSRLSVRSVDVGCPITPESEEYVDSMTFVVLEISLDQPLVQKRSAEEVDQSVLSHISARTLTLSEEENAEQVVQEYHSKIKEAAKFILGDLVSHTGEFLQNNQLPTNANEMEELKMKLSNSLKVTGKCHVLKEQLKCTVVKVVREKFFRNTCFQTEEEWQKFLQDLHVYLIDEMHSSLHDLFQWPGKPKIKSAQNLDPEVLTRMASEAELLGDIDLARKYYQELLSRNPNSCENWICLGLFYLGQNDAEKAAVCFNKVLCIDRTHIQGLILCALVASQLNRIQEATDFLDAAINATPEDAFLWTINGIFNESISNTFCAEQALKHADFLDKRKSQQMTRTSDIEESVKTTSPKDIKPEKISDGKTLDTVWETANPSGEEVPDQVDSKSKIIKRTETLQCESYPPKMSDLLMNTAEYLLKHHFPALASIALAHELVRQQTVLRGLRIQSTEESEQDQITPALSPFSVLHGVDRSLRQRWTRYQLLHASLLIKLGNPTEAETELRTATSLDPEAIDAWCMLGHLAFERGNHKEAKDYYERCIKLTSWPPKDPMLLIHRLGELYIKDGQYQKAKDLYLETSLHSPTAKIWLGVGTASYRLNEFENAKAALIEANFYESHDPTVWAMLSLISLKAGQRIEAEQTYKYANKMGLNDQNLLNELHALQREIGFGNPLAEWGKP